MSTGDELVEVLFQRAGGSVGTDGTQVGRGLAVEQAEVAQVRLRKGAQSVALNLPQQRIEAVPVILAKFDPEVRDHGSI